MQEDILLLLLSKRFHNSHALLKHNDQLLLFIIIIIVNIATLMNTISAMRSNHVFLAKRIAFISNIESLIAVSSVLALFSIIINNNIIMLIVVVIAQCECFYLFS